MNEATTNKNKPSKLETRFAYYLNICRRYTPDCGLSWDEFQRDTKYIGVILLVRHTSLDPDSVGTFFGEDGNPLGEAWKASEQLDDFSRVEAIRVDMVFSQINKAPCKPS